MAAAVAERRLLPLHQRPAERRQRPPVAPTFALESLDASTPSALAFTRATAASGFDYQGNVFQALSGEMRRQGLRRVQNTRSNSENVNAHFPTKVRCTATADSIIEDSSASTTHYVDSTVSAIAGRPILYSFSAKAAGRGFLRVQTWNATDGTQFRDFDISSGSAPTALSGIQDEGDGWFRCWVWFNYTATASSSLDIYLAASLTSTTYTGDGVSGVLLKNLMLEFPRPGQYTPSEYVSNGVLSTPYHGAFVDGVRYFDTDENGAKITGTGAGYDRDGTGAWVRSSSVAPIEVGIPVVPAQTNRITYSSDWTAWTKRGTAGITTGWDAQVGTYSIVTGLGAVGVDDVYQSYSGFSNSVRIEPLFVLRAVGTGNIVIENLQSTSLGKWTVDKSLLSTNRFEIVDRFHPAVTVDTEFTSSAAGAAGFKIYGSGAFHAALATKVEAERCYRPILSAGSVTAANADAPSFTWTAFASNNEGAIVLDFVPLAPDATAASYASGAAFVGKSTSAAMTASDGTNSGAWGDQTERTRTKIALAWQAGSGMTGYRDGEEAFADATYDGAWQATTLTLNGPMLLRELSIYPTALTATQLEALSNG